MSDFFVRMEWNADLNAYYLLFRDTMNPSNETTVWLEAQEARALFYELMPEFTPRKKQEAGPR